jgi:antitoxin component of RelBE/YafQ-DinJ toxin-antitoxin module
MRVISFRVDEDLYATIKERSEKENLPISDVVRNLVLESFGMLVEQEDRLDQINKSVSIALAEIQHIKERQENIIAVLRKNNLWH